jgi:hypothetical protein|nr:MAG TPA: protein of unknown function (DUF4373) [Caudoviricetes sp.]
MMTNNDKMLAQFGTDWVKVRDYIKSLNMFYISYTPTFMVRVEKETGVPANTVKSILDYALQIGLYGKMSDRDYITLSPVRKERHVRT